MKVILTLTNVASGPYFLVSGKAKPDKYRFERVKGQAHLHRLIVDPNAAPALFDDIGLRIQQLDIPVGISFQLEDSDLNSGDALAKKDEIIKGKDVEINDLRRLLEAEQKKPKQQQGKIVGRRITNEELEMLQERDLILEILAPLAGENDEPIDVVKRLAAPPPAIFTEVATPATNEAPPPNTPAPEPVAAEVETPAAPPTRKKTPKTAPTKKKK